MKAKTLFYALAATMMIFAACSKDEVNGNGGGTNITDQDNMAQVGTFSTPMMASLDFDDWGEANFQAMYNSSNAHVHFSAGVAWESLGKTIDLTSGQLGEDFWFRYEYMSEEGYDFTHGNYTDGSVSDYLNQSERMETSIFTSGTMTTTHTEEGWSLVIEGTLVDGNSVLIKLKVPFTEEIIPLTKNSLIYDGVKYEFTTTASQNTGTANVTWISTGENGVSSTGTVYYGSNNLGIFLEDNPTGDGYYFDFGVTAPNLQLTYHWSNDQLTGTFNGVDFTSTPFTDGMASISAYYNEMQVSVIGTLSNGKTIKFCAYSPY